MAFPAPGVCGKAMRILGVDLAWGDRNPDGAALIEMASDGVPMLSEVAELSGDDVLLDWIRRRVRDGPAVVAIDGPIVCPNPAGARPVDRETHRLFGWAHAGCYPANSARCPRPLRVGRCLEALGFRADDRLEAPRQTAETAAGPLRRQIEVFPHPAMIALFRLPRILKYKKGPAAIRRVELARFQSLLQTELPRLEPPIMFGDSIRDLFRSDPACLAGSARKRREDLLDAIVCAVVGWHHWVNGGQESQVVGDRETGFIVVPRTRPV